MNFALNAAYHRKPDTDGRHREVRDYVYDWLQCYRYHPRSRGG